MKELTVIFGFDNVTSQPLTIASLGLPATASLQTAEGYTYTAEPSNPVRDFGSNSDHKPILPPGFRAEFLGGEGWNSGTAKLGLLSYAFSPAVATSGYKLRIPSLPAEFDLAQIAARPYPTDLPDAKFHDIGQASFVIPQPQNNDGKGVKLTLDGLTPVTSADLIDAGSAYKLFSLAITATNQSQGYSANPLVAAFEDIFMVADDGGVYITSGKLTDTFSPAQGASYQSPAASWMPFVDFVHLNKLEHDPRYFEESHTVFDDPIGPGVVLQANIGISLPVGVKVAKLIMPNLDNAIVNLRL